MPLVEGGQVVLERLGAFWTSGDLGGERAVHAGLVGLWYCEGMADSPVPTADLYNAILAAWLETPSVRSVAHTLDLPRAFIASVRAKGMPELGLPPLPDDGTKIPKPGDQSKPTVMAPRKIKSGGQNGADMTLQAEIVVARQEAEKYASQVRTWLDEIEARAERMGVKADVAEARGAIDGTLAELEAAEVRVRLQQDRLATVSETAVQVDVIRRTADEAVAAHSMLRNCVTIGEIMGHIADKILEGIEKHGVTLPAAADPKVLASLAVSADKLTSAMDRALKIKKGRGGEAEQSAGMQLGILIEQCTPEELHVVQTTGRLPLRFRFLPSGDDGG